MKIYAKLILSALALSACATDSGPSAPLVRSAAIYDARQSQVRNIAIIADVCLERDEVGPDDYWSLNESRAAEQQMLEGAKAYLSKNGYKVSFAESPFVGAFKYGTGKMRFAVDARGPISERQPPLFEAEGLARDPAYRQSLITLINATMGAVNQLEGAPSNICCSKPPLRRDLDVVSRVTGGDAILFLIGDGVIVPEGKSLAQGIATGVATTVLTLGMGAYSRWDVSYLDTYAALVDVKTGDILWGSSSRTKGGGFTERDYYSESWTPNVLSHLTPRTKLTKD